jgi:hypothetical protein
MVVPPRPGIEDKHANKPNKAAWNQEIAIILLLLYYLKNFY